MKDVKGWRRNARRIACFVVVNLVAILGLWGREAHFVNGSLRQHALDSRVKVEEVMQRYTHSFRLFSCMMEQEIQEHPDPDEIWDYLKSIDAQMLDIEGETFDGLYMYYQGRYLYSWDTPYSQYESTGYVATERPWYKAAQAGGGKIVFTPPYMSYANHYILSTISQLQPDGETVFAYDIKMGDIQKLVSSLERYGDEQMMIFDSNGTVIGSSNEDYLGGDLYATQEQARQTLQQAQEALDGAVSATREQREKLAEEVRSASAFLDFRTSFDKGFARLMDREQQALSLKIGQRSYYGYLMREGEYGFLILVPVLSMLRDTVQVWLVPLLLLELLLIYVMGRIGKEQKNRELHNAYVELGQTQRRLEIALSAAQKAAAIDDLTGMMNFKSFRKGVTEQLEYMGPDESGILIMIDGDRFKTVNDNYGHMVGDEVIKLSAQMIIGRIRTVDLASRLHGDEFAIFVTKAGDYSVAKRIMEDINNTLARESQRRNMPAITLSAGAVVARHGDNYNTLTKIADEALYRAKVTHDGQFVGAAEPDREN